MYLLKVQLQTLVMNTTRSQLFLKIQVLSSYQVQKYGHSSNNYNQIDFCNRSPIHDWSNVLSQTDVEKAYDIFCKDFLKYCEPYYKPQNIKNNKIKKPWITIGLLKSIKTRDKLHRRCINQPFNNKLICEYRNYKKKLKRCKAFVENRYYESKFVKFSGNSKQHRT